MKTGLAGLLRTILHVAFIRPFLRLFFGVSVSGREHLGGLEQFILAGNHNSHLDVLLLFYAVPVRHIGKLRPVAAADYFGRSRLMARLLEVLICPLWIDRKGPGSDAVEAMKGALAAGGSLMVFPEGTRGEPGEMQRFRSGIGRVIAEFGKVPLVPAYLSGPERVMPKGTFLPLPLWNTVAMGPPLRVAGDALQVAGAAESAVRGLEMLEKAGRHRRAPRRKRTSRSVAVIGIDGSGKSTVSRRLAELGSRGTNSAWLSDRLELFEDGRPQEVQPLVTDELRKAIGRSAKRALSLKFYKIPKLAELLLRDRLLDEVERWFAPSLLAQDGSPLLNMAAWSVLYHGDLGEEECLRAIGALSGDDSIQASDPLFGKYPELLILRRMGLAHLRRPDAVIMLDLPAASAVGRIRARGGDMQAHETEEKLERLAGAYRLVCRVTGERMGIRTLTIDAQNPLEETVRVADEFVRGSVPDERN